MSTYVAGRATNLGVGEQATLAGVVSLGADTFTSPAVAIGRDASGFDLVTVFNQSNAVATVEVSATDTDAGFVPLTDGANAVTVPVGAAVLFRCIGPFARLSFPTDPAASGAVVFAR